MLLPIYLQKGVKGTNSGSRFAFLVLPLIEWLLNGLFTVYQCDGIQ